MEEYDKRKDEQIERELNSKLNKLLKLLEEAYENVDRIKVIEAIIKIYEELKVEACEYNQQDYIDKKRELAEIRYEMKREEYINSKEAQSWEDYKLEELEEEER